MYLRLKTKLNLTKIEKNLMNEISRILLELNSEEDPSMVEKGSKTKLLSDVHYELLKDRIEGIASSLINTNRSMEFDSVTGQKSNKYSKRFSELSQNDILDYAFRVAKNNPILNGEVSSIDTRLKYLDHYIKNLLQSVKESNHNKINFF